MTNDGWNAGLTYEEFMGRWSRPLAREFVIWLEVPSQSNWLDVGTGTGALAEAICDLGEPESVKACDPAAPFVDAARNRLTESGVEFTVAGAGDLPGIMDGYHAVVSNLVLNFFDDAQAAIEEQAGLLRADGVVAACVWDYADQMQFLRVFWDAARDLDSRAVEMDEATRFPICSPRALEQLFASAGLNRVRTTALIIPTVFESFEDYWAPFLGGTGPAPSFVANLSAVDRKALADSLRGRLPIADDGRIELHARAWAVAGQAV
jgi:ubiquinone/menaquinone biosynthesis C-methylase UbiE